MSDTAEAPARRAGRRDVVAAARAWIGTPYRHQASAKGVGCDCLGLVRGVYAEIVGRVPEPPAYPKFAHDRRAREKALRDALDGWCLPIWALREFGPVSPAEGDVALVSLGGSRPATHLVIVERFDFAERRLRVIHAYSGHDVRSDLLPPGWRAVGFWCLPA